MDYPFEKILSEHLCRYPLMDVQDCAKLAFQSEFGPEHIIEDAGKAKDAILSEMRQLEDDKQATRPVRISDTICRYPLSALSSEHEAKILSNLMVMTAQACKGSSEGITEKTQIIENSGQPGAHEWLVSWRESGCCAVHHSEAFRKAYSPHYRLLNCEYVCMIECLAAIDALAAGKERIVVAVEGRCGAGKTLFAETARRLFDCSVVHIDDFYIPMNQRKKDWECVSGGNIDFDRFNREVADALRNGREIKYNPYVCIRGAFGQTVELPANKLTIVEGTYCRHANVRLDYDLSVYLTCSPQVQLNRLKEREGNNLPMFLHRWIPAEERYNMEFNIEKNSDYIVVTDPSF